MAFGRFAVTIYPGGFERFFYIYKIHYLKATFVDLASSGLPFNIVRFKAPYKREGVRINFLCKTRGRIKQLQFFLRWVNVNRTTRLVLFVIFQVDHQSSLCQCALRKQKQHPDLRRTAAAMKYQRVRLSLI